MRERTGHPPSYAKAKKMKSLMLLTLGCQRPGLRDCFSFYGCVCVSLVMCMILSLMTFTLCLSSTYQRCSIKLCVGFSMGHYPEALHSLRLIEPRLGEDLYTVHSRPGLSNCPCEFLDSNSLIRVLEDALLSGMHLVLMK